MSEIADHQSLRADARANRQSLLAAAAALFAERGTDVPYEEIAERAGVGRATLYRHFPTRELLLAGLLEDLMDELETAAAELPSGPERLIDLFELCLHTQQRHLPILDLVTQAANEEQLAEVRGRFQVLLRDPLAESQAAGLVRAELHVADVRLLLVMLSSLNRRTVTDEDRARAVTLAEAVLTGTLP